MRFLESGAFPWTEKDWPLPDTGLPPPAAPRGRELPMRYVLIDIAIHEKQPDQVLRWYDMKPEDYVGADRMDRVATAVMEYATDRSVGLWKKLAEWEISKSSPPPTKRRPVTCGSSRVCWSSRDGRRSGRPTSRDSGPAMQGSGA